MKIIVNGETSEAPEGYTLGALIESHHLTPDKVAVELNRRLVHVEKYETVLKEGDAVEIVTFVGGG